MSCFGLEWIEQFLIWLVVVCAVVAVVRVLLPHLLNQLGTAGNIVLAVLNIAMWAVVAIFAIVVCFDLVSCLFSLGGSFLHVRPLIHN